MIATIIDVAPRSSGRTRYIATPTSIPMPHEMRGYCTFILSSLFCPKLWSLGLFFHCQSFSLFSSLTEKLFLPLKKQKSRNFGFSTSVSAFLQRNIALCFVFILFLDLSWIRHSNPNSLQDLHACRSGLVRNEDVPLPPTR